MADAPKEKRPRSNHAQIASAVIAFLGFFVLTMQVGLISKNFKVAAARQVYMSYSEAAIRYPELAEPDFPDLKRDHEKYVRYKSFVSHMLFAYDEILAVYDEPEWRRSFDSEIRFHMAYICNDMTPADDATYFSNMRELLKEARVKCPAPAKS